MHSPDTSPRILLGNKAVGLAVLLLATAGALAAWSLAPGQTVPEVPDFIPNCYVTDASPQRLAHKALLAGTGFFALLLPLLRAPLSRALGQAWTSRVNALAAGFLAPPLWALLAALPVCLWAHRTVGRDQFAFGLAASVLVLAFGHRLAQSPLLRRCIGLVLWGIVAALLAVGFIGPYSFAHYIAHSSYHYFTFLGLGPLMSHGAGILEGSRFFYGLTGPGLVAILDARLGPLPIIFYVRVVQTFLVVFAALALLCYRRLAPGRPGLWALFILFWLPWLMTTGGDGITPTNSGMRPLWLALAPLVLLWAENLGRTRQPLALGAVAGLSLLWNLETGICVTLGLAAYSVVCERPGNISAWLRRLAALSLGIFCAAAAEALLLRLGLGRWPGASAETLFYQMSIFASAGYGGILWEFDPLAVVVFLYPVLLLGRLTSAWLREPLSPRMRFKFAVAIMTLVWGAYYFNRAWSYTLYLSAFQLTLLIADRVPPLAAWTFRWKGLGAALQTKIPAAFALFALLIGPTTVDYGLTGCKDVWRFAQLRWKVARSEGAGTMSGIWLKAEDLQKLALQKQFLDAIPKNKKVVFSGPVQFFQQLETGRFFDMQEQDIYWGSFATVDFERNVASLLRHDPDLLLLDDSAAREAFNEGFMRRLEQHYTRTGTQNGWIVLERVGTRQ